MISEVYGGGGNAGALARDFIELANVSRSTVDLSAYSVQYASATGGWQVTPLTGITTVPAGEQVLIGEATGANTSLPGFTADVEGSIPMSRLAGQVALVAARLPLQRSDGSRRPRPGRRLRRVGWRDALRSAARRHPAPPTRRACRVTAPSPTGDNAADFTHAARRRRQDCPRIPATRPIRPTRPIRRTGRSHRSDRPGGRCHRRRPGRRRCLAIRRPDGHHGGRRLYITRPAASTAT
ncbi:MAG: lamin tail domain-containing protein [Microbacterium sp.]